MRPSLSRIADAEEHETRPPSDAKRGRNDFLAAHQRGGDHIALFDASADEVAIEFCGGFVIQVERQCKGSHAHLLLRIRGVEQRQSLVNTGYDPKCFAGLAI